jgi:hypothetical protein
MTILLANLGIGFLNDLFLGLSHSAGPEELSIPFLVDEKTRYCTGRLGRKAVVSSAKGSLMDRSLEVKAALQEGTCDKRQ